MGDIADMMIEGILDANGEYTGRNPGHPVYPKGWFEKGNGFNHAENRVKCFLMQRGIKDADEQRKALKDYSIHVGITKKYINHANGNWNIFKGFIDARVGYVKPSKQPKP